jgi:hypothetical protein
MAAELSVKLNLLVICMAFAFIGAILIGTF